ncbi:MAG: helix-turn-helix domain-containing protein [Crocosphaera sp.]|nr:helix-turn-helix domain-containing protein [Crocosphaera sp.]
MSSYRETAKEIGKVSPSTLSRIENGKVPDLDTFLALCDWLEVPPTKLIQNTEEKEDLDTAEVISIRLRGDKNLDPAIANVLASLVKVGYQLSQKRTTSKPDYTLEELLAGASSEDMTGEYDWGKPMGKEIWQGNRIEFCINRN